MSTQRILIPLAFVAIIFLGGCVATPYYGGTGYYRGAAYGYSYQPSYYAGQGYMGGGFGYPNRGHRHNHGHMHQGGEYRPFAGDHRHIGGGHRHHGRGHWGGGHRGGHHRR